MHTFAFVSYSHSSDHHLSSSLFLYHQNTQVLLECSQWKRALRTVHAFKKCSGEIVPDTPLRYTSYIGILLLICNPILDKHTCVGHLTIRCLLATSTILTSMFRMLVRRFPDLAEKVMDACITQVHLNTTAKTKLLQFLPPKKRMRPFFFNL